MSDKKDLKILVTGSAGIHSTSRLAVLAALAPLIIAEDTPRRVDNAIEIRLPPKIDGPEMHLKPDGRNR